MELTKEEFSLFSLKSKIQLIEKDGDFIARRVCEDLYLISLYSIYGFFIETIYDISHFKTLSITPIINLEIAELYDFNYNMEDAANLQLHYYQS